MKDITRSGSKSQLDFVLTPLGHWAVTPRDEALLTPAGRIVQRRTGLPAGLSNLYAELNGLDCQR
jgi:hypothetical protein